MATFIRIKDNNEEIRYVNRDYIDTFAYDRVNNKTRIGTVGDPDGYFEIDDDITDLILNPEKQGIDDWFKKRLTIDHLLIGDRLTRLMAERGLCAADVARMLDGGKGNWSAASVRKWMTDESQPSAATLVGLADILGCSLDYLMTGKEYTPKRTLDSTMVSVEDVLEAIRDYAHYPDAQLHAGDLMTHLEHALKGR